MLVYEGEDYYVGASVAQLLAAQGHSVTVATQHQVLGAWMEKTLEHPWMMSDLRRLGVKVLTGTMLKEVRPGVAVTSDIWQPEAVTEHAIDSVVMCSGRISNAELYQELRLYSDQVREAGIEQLFLIGSASAPGMMVDSIFDGHRLAREIDSADPSQPLPFIRERRIWGVSNNARFDEILRSRS